MVGRSCHSSGVRKLAIHFARFGPYHLARIDSAAAAIGPVGWEVIGLEAGGSDVTYDWREELSGTRDWQRHTVFPGEAAERISQTRLSTGIHSALDQLKPHAVAISGWGSPDARACLAWCRKNGARAIVMSETRETDGQRKWWKEFLKSRIIRRFDAALVGGRSHRDYLIKLGIPASRIRFGYNAVDNAYFAEECLKARKSQVAGQESKVGNQDAERSSTKNQGPRTPNILPLYFLASNRFIERKNLARLIESYALYTGSPDHRIAGSPLWNLCLLGDGELKASLIARCRSLGLHVAERAPWEVEEKAEGGNLKPVEEKPEGGNLKPEGGDQEAANIAQVSTATQVSALSPQVSKYPQVSALSDPLTPIVFFPGFRQIEELPRFYTHAGCFVHPALEEPWGLVINEAMACGLPILSGNNVGAAEELVAEGVNGWIFDAGNVGVMAECLGNMTGQSEQERLSMGAASARILEERCPTAAFGHGLAELLHGQKL